MAAAIFLLLCSAGAVPAVDDTQGGLMARADRVAVHEALQAVRRKDWQLAETLIARTRDPLAAKIYYWFYYSNGGADASFGRVSSFIRQNPAWPRQSKMRLTAEKRMAAAQMTPADVVSWFDDFSPLTPDGMDAYLQALLKQGQEKKAEDVLRAWWKSAALEPAQQESFLARYGKIMDANTHVARFGWLLMRKQYTNARALARVLGKGYPALAEARIALAEGRAGVDGAVASVPPHLQNDPGLLLERLRWRRRNGKEYGALEILHNMPPPAIIPNPDEWWAERHIMVRRLMEQGRYESAFLLAEKHGLKEGVSFAEAAFLSGWLALKADKPWRAFEHFEALYHRTTTPISRARGAYWAGRASEALGHADIAQKWYRTAARYPVAFYGQAATGRLADEYRPPQQVPPAKTVAGEQAFERSEMVQVARILKGAGFREETGAFLDALADDVKTPEDYLLVADLAAELDHRHNAIRIAKRGLQKGILLMDQAYPTLLAGMKKVDLEWALVHALIRQESAFDPQAQSPAGARGLMQLMPATAQGVARGRRMSYQTSWLTSNPDYNIRIGSLYLAEMLDKYDGSYALALAAYNGGPGRVDRWLKENGDPRKGEIDMIDWIESIPIEETRNYVQRVMEGVYIYRIKMNGVQKSFNAPIHAAVNQ